MSKYILPTGLKILSVALLSSLVFSLTACGAEKKQTDMPSPAENIADDTEEPVQSPQTTPGEQGGAEEDTEMKMSVQVGGAAFSATLEDNEAVSELVEMMQESPVVIEMNDYSGFEKVGPLGRSLTASDNQTTTQTGDIVLYNGNQIVIFYGSNSWSYTRLGHIDDLTGWEDALGSGDVTVAFSLE